MPDYTFIEYYVDKAIALARKHHEYLMYLDRTFIDEFNQDVQPEMYIASNFEEYKNKSNMMKLVQPNTSGAIVHKITDEYKEWKPIPSTISQRDIKEQENYFSIKFPDSYKWYLSYMHFYQIYWNIDIKLYPLPIKTWSDILQMKNAQKQDFVLKKGLFSIGEYSDHGDICFDLNETDLENNDYPIVYVDYETGEVEPLAPNFESLLQDILSLTEPELKELNPTELRLYSTVVE